MTSQDAPDAGQPISAVTVAAWERRKQFVGFGADDVAILRELHLVARTYADDVMAELYRRWLGADELQAFFPDEVTLRRVQALQKEYFISLTLGDYGPAYLADRMRIGRVHWRIGLTPSWYMCAYAVYVDIVLPRVLAAFEYDRGKQRQAVHALMKLIALDQELALTAYWDEGTASLSGRQRTPR